MLTPRHPITTLAATTLVLIATACATTATAPTPKSTTGNGQPSEAIAQPPAEFTGDTPAAPNLTCTTWQDYRTITPTLPAMPTGFEQGCIFTAETQTADPAPIHVLYSGIELSDIATAESALSTDGTPPQIRLQPDLDSRFLQSNAVTTYSPACALIDPSRHRNCDNPPTYSAYLITADNTVCFENQCIQSTATPTPELLTLWDASGYAFEDMLLEYRDPAARSQYRPLPLQDVAARFNSIVDAPFSTRVLEQNVVAYSPWAIALQAYGRETLEDGIFPTVIADVPVARGRAVTVTNLGEFDDSRAGARYRLEFEFIDGNKVKLTWAGIQTYCRRTSPPQWSTERCP